MTGWILAVTALVHGLRLLAPSDWGERLFIYGAFSTEVWEWIVSLPLALETLPLFATPVSHALLHLDAMHLMVNMGFLLAFGTVTERRLGAPRFLAFYALGALAGAFGVSLSYLITQQPIVVVGASGAISALLGAWVRFDLGRRRAAPGRLPPAVVGLAAFIGLNIFTGLAFDVAGDIKIAWEAHLGGLLFGFFLFPLFDRGYTTIPPQPGGPGT